CPVHLVAGGQEIVADLRHEHVLGQPFGVKLLVAPVEHSTLVAGAFGHLGHCCLPARSVWTRRTLPARRGAGRKPRSAITTLGAVRASAEFCGPDIPEWTAESRKSQRGAEVGQLYGQVLFLREHASSPVRRELLAAQIESATRTATCCL